MEKVRLGDIAVLINGDRGKNYPSQADITNEGEIPFVNAGHLNGRNIDFVDMNYISQEKYDKLSSGKFERGDILYCLRGSLGKKAIVKDNVTGAIASSLVIIRPNYEKVYGDYLMFSLDSPSIKEQLVKANNGSSQPNLSAASVREYQIELPDMEHQKAVVENLSKISSIIDKRQAELDVLNNLIKARFVEMFGDIKINEHNYKKVEIGSVLKSCEAGWSGNGTQRIKRADEIAVLKVSAVTKGYFIPEECKVLDDQKNIKKYVIPEKGDLLFSRANTREMVGATAIVKEDHPTLILSDKLWKIRFNDSVNVFYMKYILSSESIRKIFSVASTGTSGSMFNVSKDKFKEIEIPVAPIELQNQFADFVRTIDKSKVVAYNRVTINNKMWRTGRQLVWN